MDIIEKYKSEFQATTEELDELLNLAKDKPKLRKLIKKTIDYVALKGGMISIIDSPDVKFDVELEEDFDSNMVSYFEPSTYIEGEDDGWWDSEILSEFANLMSGWNWNAVTLNNGKILIPKSHNLDNTEIDFTIYDTENLVNGSIESRHWLDINIIPEGVMEQYNSDKRNRNIDKLVKN